MFPYIRRRSGGEITFDEAKKYGTERRRAGLSFSIAYGKTVYGLSRTGGSARPGAGHGRPLPATAGARVAGGDDQDGAQGGHAHADGAVPAARHQRLAGDARALQRAAINTPIQGGAADIMTLAMLKIANTPRLKGGYRLLLQIRDEVILEGPEEHAAAAREEVMRCMEQPFDDALPGMLVDLVVDCKVRVDPVRRQVSARLWTQNV